MSSYNSTQQFDTNSPVVFTDGSEMDIYGIPMIIDEPLRNKYSRFAIFMGIIIVILVIMLIIAVINIKKHKKARTHKAQNLYNQYLHERNLCKVLYGESNPPVAQYIEILIDPSSFPDAAAKDISNMISYLIAVDRDGKKSTVLMPNSEWTWSGDHWKWKTVLNLNDNVQVRSVTLILDINLLSLYSKDDRGKDTIGNTTIITTILRNKLGNMIWQKTGGYINNPSINIEIDRDLFL
jgi:hypothetical protein